MPGTPDFEQTQTPVFQVATAANATVNQIIIQGAVNNPMRIWGVRLHVNVHTLAGYAGGFHSYVIAVQDKTGIAILILTVDILLASVVQSVESRLDTKGIVPNPNAGIYGLDLVIPGPLANTGIDVDVSAIYSLP